MAKNFQDINNKSKIWRELATALIGLKILIVHGSSKDFMGVSGVIVDETHNILKIKTKEKIVSIQKDKQIFEITTRENIKVIVEGNLLLGLPSQRVKKKIPSW